MSPEQRLGRLRREIQAELERLDRTAAELAELGPSLVAGCPPPVRVAVAGYLHAFYTGCEAVIARLARSRGELPRGEGWHQALLVRAAAPIAGDRPPFVSPETAVALFELLRFRHFFRTQYGVELAVDRLRLLVDLVPATHAGFTRDIAGFLDAMAREG